MLSSCTRATNSRKARVSSPAPRSFGTGPALALALAWTLAHVATRTAFGQVPPPAGARDTLRGLATDTLADTMVVESLGLREAIQRALASSEEVAIARARLEQ